MNKKITKLIAAFALLVFMMPTMAGWGQLSTSNLNFGTPQISEDFNSLDVVSNTSTINNSAQTAYGVFNKMYNNNTANTYAIVNDETLFNSKILSLTSGNTTSPLIASITKVNGQAVEFESTGAFSVRIARTNNTMFGFYAADDNNAYAKAYSSVYLKNTAGSLTLQDGAGNWTSIGYYGSQAPAILEICVIYNNTNSTTTYGDNISISSKRAHVFVNGSCIMNRDNPKEFTIPGANLTVFRVVTSTSGGVCTIDDVKIYDALPTSSGPTQLSTPTNFSAAPGNAQATFTWTAVENASSYTVSYTPDGGEEEEFENATSPQVITGLTNGKEYTCKIKAVGDGEDYSDSDYSSTITVTPTNATFYNIVIASSITGGNVTASAATATAGTTITLTATPSDAYTFTNITSNWNISPAVTVTPGENNTATFEMPASDVSVSATFNAKPTFAVACVADPVAGGSIVASPASAYEGQTITLSCTTNTGYSLTGVVITKTSDSSATGITPTASGDNFVFTMPDYAVTVTATFKPVYVSGGSFQKHTGDLEEGYYVITYNTYTMKNTISSSRFTNGASITNGANIIENIDKNIVWYIAKDGDYWTLYNEDVDKFAAGTTTNNQGALVDNVTDYAKWIVTKSNGKFEFENYGRTSQTNKWLRNNTGSGWACYSTSTGGAVTLYKYFNANRALVSIAVSGQTTDYIVGDAFSFDGVCTATYDDESTNVVTPTSVSTPDMTTAGSKTITVTYTEKEVTKTTTYSISVVENPYVTTTLEGDDMAAMTNAGDGYNVNKTVTTSDGFLWETNGYQTTYLTNMIQLRNRTDNNGVSYIKLPEVDGAIKKLTFAVTGSSADSPSGLTTSNKLYFQQSNTKDEAIIAEGGGSSTHEIVIDLINTFYSKGYITASGSLRVWSVSMEYIPYSDLEGNTITEIAGNSAVAIPKDVNATATDLAIPANSSVIVRSGATLTVTGTLTDNDPANLIIEDGGQLIHTNAVQATVKKNISGHNTGSKDAASSGWYFIATTAADGTTPTTLNGLLDATPANFDLYYYHEPDHYWINYKGTADHEFVSDGGKLLNGKGYLYANANNAELSFEGATVAANKKIDLELSYSDAIFPGFNLVGNPFTYQLTSSSEITLNGSALSAYYMIVDGEEISATTISDTPINPGTGFMVQANAEDQHLVFNPSGDSKGERASKPSYIRIEAGDEDFMDRAYVQFGQGNTLRKMTINDNVSHVYVMSEGKDYAAATIQEAQGEMPVNFKARRDGQYTITVNPQEVEMDYLHLIDNIVGVDVDLLALRPFEGPQGPQAQGPASYTFTAKADDYESRFRLVFSAKNDNDTNLNEDFAFFSNGSLIVTGEGTLQVVDMMGRVISTETVNGTSSKAINAKAGVYVLRLVNGENVKTQKIVVR